MRIASSLLSVIAVVGLLGCKDGSVELMKFADKACACKDVECARGVLGELSTFLAEHPRLRGDQERANEAAKKLGGCAIERGVGPDEVMKTINRSGPAKAP